MKMEKTWKKNMENMGKHGENMDTHRMGTWRGRGGDVDTHVYVCAVCAELLLCAYSEFKRTSAGVGKS
jgi:hypothetical protein